MKEALCIVFAILFFFFTFATPASASEALFEDLGGTALEEVLPEEGNAALEDGLKNGSVDGALNEIFQQGLSMSGGIIQQSIQSMVLVFAALLLCGICRTLIGEKHSLAVSVAGALSIGTVTMTQFSALYTLISDTLESMDVLIKALLPVMTAAGCAAGAPMSTTARYVATTLFSSILFSAIRMVLLPCTVASAVLWIADAAFPERGIARLAQCFSSCVKWVLTAILTIFTGYLSLSGILSGSSDALAVKGVKMGISTVVPVVGAVLADAADTVLAAASLVRSVVGVAGLVGVLALCLVPLLRLTIGFLLFRITAALCAPFAEKGHCQLLDGIAGVYGLMLGQVGAGGFLIFLSIASAALFKGGSA